MPIRPASFAIPIPTLSLTILLGAAAIAPTALAQPDIKPGRWETTATTTVKSEQFNMPPTTHTSTDCVTMEDIEQGQAFMDDVDGCKINSRDVRDDGMDISMVCEQGEGGGTMSMDASFEFDGDSSRGTMTGTLQGGPMGSMDMSVQIESKRVGNC